MRDDINTEFMLQHMPLSDVLAFVVARDDVARISPVEVERASDLERVEIATMPAPSGVQLLADAGNASRVA